VRGYDILKFIKRVVYCGNTCEYFMALFSEI